MAMGLSYIIYKILYVLTRINLYFGALFSTQQFVTQFRALTVTHFNLYSPVISNNNKIKINSELANLPFAKKQETPIHFVIQKRKVKANFKARSVRLWIPSFARVLDFKKIHKTLDEQPKIIRRQKQRIQKTLWFDVIFLSIQ